MEHGWYQYTRRPAATAACTPTRRCRWQKLGWAWWLELDFEDVAQMGNHSDQFDALGVERVR